MKRNLVEKESNSNDFIISYLLNWCLKMVYKVYLSHSQGNYLISLTVYIYSHVTLQAFLMLGTEESKIH